MAKVPVCRNEVGAILHGVGRNPYIVRGDGSPLSAERGDNHPVFIRGSWANRDDCCVGAFKKLPKFLYILLETVAQVKPG